jgi:hypothetical protein
VDQTIINSPNFRRENVGFEHIIVGPALSDQQVFAVDALLASEHMNFLVEKSNVPYVAD